MARPFLSDLDRLIDSAEGPRVTAEHAAPAGRGREPRVRLGLRGGRRGARHARGPAPSRQAPLGRDVRGLPAVGRQGRGALRPRRRARAARPRSSRSSASSRATCGGCSPCVRPSRSGARRCAARTTARSRTASCPRSRRRGRACRRCRSRGTRSSSTRRTSRALNWTADELADALVGIEAIDRGVKTGAGSGSELLEAWLLARARPARCGEPPDERGRTPPPPSASTGATASSCAACLAVIVLGAAVGRAGFTRAFPEASIDFKVTREEAVRRGADGAEGARVLR